jgi:ribosome biogenesis GTPase
MSRLTALGWAEYFELQNLISGDETFAARVIAQHSNLWRISTGEAELDAELRGKLRDFGARPVTGDFVVARGKEHAVIENIYARRTSIARKNPGRALEAQVLAANVDLAFLVMALDGDYSVRRLERYLISVREGGVEPVVVLNKADLVAPEILVRKIEECRQLSLGSSVHAISTLDGSGVAELIAEHVRPARTVVLLGSSGVGKSTLLNVLAGGEIQRTQAVRDSDGKGRHTTTHRELVRLPNGGLVLDTPGLRELALWTASSGFESTFADVGELAENCKFKDCGHKKEPGCAVQEAIALGTLAEDRFESYRAMQKELEYLARRENPSAMAEENGAGRSFTRRRRRDIESAADR